MRLRTVMSITVAAGLLAAPLSAHASTAEAPTVTITHLPGDPGILVATASSDSPISAVVAQVRAGETEPMTVDLSLDEASNTWRSTRLKLPDYREYQVSAVATDTDADTSTTPATAVLPYLKQPVVLSHTTGTTALDVQHPLVRSVGQIKVLDPRTGTQAAPDDGRVEVRWDGGEPVPGSDQGIDPEGRYALGLRPTTIANGGTSKLTIGLAPEADTAKLEDTAWGKPYLDQVDVTTAIGAAKVAMNTPKAWVKYPAKLLIAGTLKVGTLPVPDAVLQLSFKGKVLPDVVRTGADGRFAVTVTPRYDGAYSLLWKPTEHQAPYVTTPSATGAITVSVIDRTTIKFVQPSINDESMFHIHGQLKTSSNTLPPKGSQVWLQRSTTGRSGWKNVGYVPTSYHGFIKLDGYVPQASGYFRLYYYGASGLQPSVSWVWRSSRKDTRVLKLNAAPEPVRKGATVTVSGTVQKLTTSWVSIGKGQEVQVFFRAKGAKASTPFSYVGSARTSATGAFSYKAKAVKDGDWTAAWFTPSQWYVNAYGALDAVDVK